MAGFFYKLGKACGPKARKAAWAWHSLFGDEGQSIKAEAAMGQDILNQVLNQMPQIQTVPEIASVLDQLTNCLLEKRRKYAITLVESPKPNAFALPGGYIVMTHSLWDLCDRDRHATAFILAHEMAHILRGHAMERLAVNAALSTASSLPTLRNTSLAWLRKAGIQALEAAYSQDRELEADGFAVRLVQAADYDPLGAETLFTRLDKLTQPQELEALRQYFNSHPPFNQRITEIKRVLQTCT